MASQRDEPLHGEVARFAKSEVADKRPAVAAPTLRRFALIHTARVVGSLTIRPAQLPSARRTISATVQRSHSSKRIHGTRPLFQRHTDTAATG